MSPLAITFFVALPLSFAILMFSLRPEVSSKSARKRLVIIQDSVRPHTAGA